MKSQSWMTASRIALKKLKRYGPSTLLMLSLLAGFDSLQAQTQAQDDPQEIAAAFAAMIFAMLPPADENGKLTRNGVPIFIKVTGLEDESVAVDAQNKITESMVSRNAELFAEVLFEHSLGVDMESSSDTTLVFSPQAESVK